MLSAYLEYEFTVNIYTSHLKYFLTPKQYMQQKIHGGKGGQFC